MFRRFTVIVIAGLALAPAARAVTLVPRDPGVPVPSYLQQQANGSRVPTVAGNLDVFVMYDRNDPQCNGAMACSSSPNMLTVWNHQLISQFAGDQPVTYISDIATRWDLYWELGHQFDWAYLTPQERYFFAFLWGVPNHQWWDSYRSLSEVSEDGLEAQFAGDYANCAIGARHFVSWVPGVHHHFPWRQECRLIRRIAAR